MQQGWGEPRGPHGALGPADLQAMGLCGYSEEQKENGDAHSDTLTSTQQSVGREQNQDSVSVRQMALGFDPP